MRKTASTHWWILAAACCCMLLFSTPSSAAGNEATNATPKIDNVGFMKNPPKELVDRFPMCDKFLNVEWIDDLIGFVKYDLYDRRGHKIVSKFSELIFFDDRNPLGADYVEFNGKEKNINEMTSNEVNSLFEVLRGSDMAILQDWNIKVWTQDNSVTVYRSPLGASGGSYANGKWNICLPYPKNEKMWIVEFKKVGGVYSDRQIKLLRKYLKKSRLNGNVVQYIDNMEEFSVVDLNFDNKDDFFLSMINGLEESILYFKNSQYYEMEPMWSSQGDETFGHYMFPPDGNECVANSPTTLYITTNGTSYFLDNECNLTRILNREGM